MRICVRAQLPPSLPWEGRQRLRGEQRTGTQGAEFWVRRRAGRLRMGPRVWRADGRPGGPTSGTTAPGRGAPVPCLSKHLEPGHGHVPPLLRRGHLQTQDHPTLKAQIRRCPNSQDETRAARKQPCRELQLVLVSGPCAGRTRTRRWQGLGSPPKARSQRPGLALPHVH